MTASYRRRVSYRIARASTPETLSTTRIARAREGRREAPDAARRVADWRGFLPPPPRTVREVFPHTAHRHPSPGGVHGLVGHGFPADGSDESARDQIALPREQRPPFVQWALALVFLAEEACDAIEAEAVDLVEASRRVAV